MGAAPAGAVRTWLFAPADQPARCLKALASDADQVIWDLEDGVAQGRKDAARAALAELLQARGATAVRRHPWVRVRSPLGADGRADLALLRQLGALERLVVPKADGPSLHALGAAVRTGRWLLLIESARGLWDLARGRMAIPPGVEARLAFGALDYALDLGIDAGGDEPELLHARSQIVWMSRVLGLALPIDSVDPAIGGAERLAEAARRARRLGFAGKMAIHPAQLGPIAAAFAPDEATVAWARRVLAAAVEGEGATRVDDAMVDRPVVERARAVLAALGEGAGPAPAAAVHRKGRKGDEPC